VQSVAEKEEKVGRTRMEQRRHLSQQVTEKLAEGKNLLAQARILSRSLGNFQIARWKQQNEDAVFSNLHGRPSRRLSVAPQDVLVGSLSRGVERCAMSSRSQLASVSAGGCVMAADSAISFVTQQFSGPFSVTAAATRAPAQQATPATQPHRPRGSGRTLPLTAKHGRAQQERTS
jgi:hypothetical protein